MKKLSTILLVFLLVAAVSSFAADEKKDDKLKLKNQTHCPIMGGKIDSTSYTDIQGQRVYHCCPMCTKKLKADPDKYFETAAKDGILYENIQTFCPVSSKALKEKEVFIDYNGRRVYFCCDNCIADFNKDPQAYLKMLDGKQEMKAESSEEKHNHNH